MFAQINYLAVIVIVILHQILGALWYAILGKPWMKAIGAAPEQFDGKDPAPYIVSLVSSIVFTLALAAVMQMAGITGIAKGALFGVIVAIAFSISSLATHYAFGGSAAFSSHWIVFAIDSGRDILIGLTAGIILGIWRGSGA
jgi:hypothetical protein